MKVAILDFSQLASSEQSSDCLQSQLASLSQAFLKAGHDVIWFCNIWQPQIVRDIICLPLQAASSELLETMDVVAVFHALEKGEEIARQLGISTHLIFLTNCERKFLAKERFSQPGYIESFDTILCHGEWHAHNLQWFQGVLKTASISQKAYRYFLKHEYASALETYEQAILQEPNNLRNYWYYGLCLLLQGQETEAQSVWFFPFLEFDLTDIEQCTQELVAILHKEAQKQYDKEQDTVAWTIRQHVREFDPNHTENLISLIYLSLQLNLLSEYEFLLDEFANIITPEVILEDRFKSVIQLLFDILSARPPEEVTHRLVAAFRKFCKESNTFLHIFWEEKSNLLNSEKTSSFARLKIAELATQLEPNNFVLWIKVSIAANEENQFDKAVYASQQMLKFSRDLAQQVISYFQMLKALLYSGVYNYHAQNIHPKFLEILKELIQSNPPVETLHPEDILGSFQMITATCYFPYLQDNPREMHNWRGASGRFWQNVWQRYAENYLPKKNNIQHRLKIDTKANKDKIKIGYISTSLRKHSVGHLSRWLFQEYDRDKFDFYIYSLLNIQDFLTLFFERNSYFRDFSNEEQLLKISQAIQEDAIDILIDLDGLTNQKISRVMLMKPAPIQATWLGFDASGIPAIDYFIADPYVLPEKAQEYYNETIWRLPQTYIAISGFDVGVPNISREDLEIPEDAVIYLSSQTGQKRNFNNIRLQMQVIRKVPNSYFITKTSGADQEAIQRFFTEIAAEEGINSDRLRFLSEAPSEAIHRANIAIADVVLDTYPYNGATTTMETLWMEVPMVTRVGEQFAARNSYAMMVNAGIEEGIAWTDEEYVEWGIRLGKEPQLRKEVSWKLKQSKKSAPLWNAKQFTRDMEAAYQQMWQKYIEESSE